MFEKFALNILDEVAEKCDSKYIESKKEAFNAASQKIVEAMIELSRKEESPTK